VVLTGSAGVALLVGRLLFGGVLAFTGLNHFRNTEATTGYAESKGLPAPRLGVLGSGGLLVAGGLGVALGVAPVLSAFALATFLIVAAVTMHDFWAVPAEQTQDELTAFLKNVALAGGALAVAAAASEGLAFGFGLGVL
jgi:uncharacterized membrane protein YphA (DoxX/SURF4 family)